MDNFFEFSAKKPILLNTGSKYEQIIRRAFFLNYTDGCHEFTFSRDQIDGSALGLDPKNIGDIIYSYRYRRELPQDILDCAPPDKSWIIEGAGGGLYRFKAVKHGWFIPNEELIPIMINDWTPEEVIEHGIVKDEQAILTTISYNNLLDLFLWCRLSLKQSHWRTNIKNVGQIEIDFVFIGISNTGEDVVVPVQAKTGKDFISSVQIKQDIMACNERDDGKICRSTAVHYDHASKRIAMMEFKLDENDDVILVNEFHYKFKKKYSDLVVV